MTLDVVSARQYLKNFDFHKLFIEELGWDNHAETVKVPLGGTEWELSAIAHKRGMVAFHCSPPDSEDLPDYQTRRKIERQVAKSAHEHFIIFTDNAKITQTWQWLKVEPGKPNASREHSYTTSQQGDALIQKLQAIAFTIDEEESLTLVDVAGRTRVAFDVERVTKRFYDQFKKEHDSFLKFIDGITEGADREWYASVMLNRLMFVYFVQRKGFLDGDTHYLRNRLERMRQTQGNDKFHSFYRFFLLRLFHDGLGGAERTPELENLLGRIPYLNGGLFDIHELERNERYGEQIQIPDEAFTRIFNFFDRFQWHLDERPTRNDDEINPDVLGYIFEKYINQKQTGAYYTKEDITEYIGNNTIIPFLFETARKECRVAFENPEGPTVWDLLSIDSERYIFPAVRHGITWNYQSTHPHQGTPLSTPHDLPDDILAGIDPPTLEELVGDDPGNTSKLRELWRLPAPSEYALPTESWREVVERRARFEKMKVKLNSGDIQDINDLITLNVDMRQFAQDVIQNCEGPDLLRAMWHAIEKVTVLDPTCGSGAFLFAALNILEPLYQACLNRMEGFLDELDRSDDKSHPEKYSDFRKVLENVQAHPNRRYFVLKNIILNNLYGVDIMEEAVEICKLRLFLKLAAQVDPDINHANYGMEPLPDIDFNIKAGNTLVGFATYNDVERTIKSRLDFDDAMSRISTAAADLQDAFDAFKARQIESAESVPTSHKYELSERLGVLKDELNQYLASEYGITSAQTDVFNQWMKSHRPFHWFIEFFGIMAGGGFDVIIGNPPYIEYSKIRSTYKVGALKTIESGNLYALIIERCTSIQRKRSFFGMIIQLSAFCTPRMHQFQNVWFSSYEQSWLSFFDDRPGKLFDGLQHIRTAIAIGRFGGKSTNVYTSRYNKFATAQRPSLFSTLSYEEYRNPRRGSSVLKISSELENSLTAKLWNSKTKLADFLQVSASEDFVYYGYGFGYWGKVLNFKSYFSGESVSKSTGDKYIYMKNGVDRDIVAALMNSSLFYWFYVNYSDGHNFTKHVIGSIPFSYPQAGIAIQLKEACARLMEDLRKNASRRTATYKATGTVVYDEFYPKFSKPIIDEIDQLLAVHYGFTEEELDFITSYDIKYRMGRDGER